MRLLTWHDLTTAPRPLMQTGTALCVGGFDGPHTGHASLFDAVFSAGAGRNLQIGVVTFTEPPKAVNEPNGFDGCISTLSLKLAFFEGRGFDFAVVIPFTDEVRTLSGAAFLDTLRSALSLSFLASGRDFRCGYRAATGTAETAEWCAKNGVGYRVVADTLSAQGEKVSSSAIRRAVLGGELSKARELLGRPYTIDIQNVFKAVFPGGSGFSFNRAQLSQILPPSGSYSAELCLGQGGTVPATVEIAGETASVFASGTEACGLSAQVLLSLTFIRLFGII